jgi:hypothetical protein
MKKVLNGVILLVVAVTIAIAGFLIYARFHDGPLEIVSGGPFRSGEPAPTPASWDFVADYDTIEFQTLEPARSRTVWLGVHDERLFILSGYMNSGVGAVWKQWPHYLEDDDRIILRVDGRLYEQRLQRITSGPDIIPVLQEFNRKYGIGEVTSTETVTSGDTWMFEVLPRGSGDES